MASQFDESDFVDRDYHGAKSPQAMTTSQTALGTIASRPPTREELDTKVGDAQQKLAELKRAQEELERERVALEEARRRRAEFQIGREEMVQNLTRGVGLMEEAEFGLRRESEQMAKTLAGLRDALAKVQAVREEAWTPEAYNVELTRALTTVENARLEWNSARLKWDLLNGPTAEKTEKNEAKPGLVEGRSFLELCKIGLALNWPTAAVSLAGFILIATLLLWR
jgi:chromosome segregation ATPase